MFCVSEVKLNNVPVDSSTILNPSYDHVFTVTDLDTRGSHEVDLDELISLMERNELAGCFPYNFKMKVNTKRIKHTGYPLIVNIVSKYTLALADMVESCVFRKSRPAKGVAKQLKVNTNFNLSITNNLDYKLFAITDSTSVYGYIDFANLLLLNKEYANLLLLNKEYSDKYFIKSPEGFYVITMNTEKFSSFYGKLISLCKYRSFQSLWNIKNFSFPLKTEINKNTIKLTTTFDVDLQGVSSLFEIPCYDVLGSIDYKKYDRIECDETIYNILQLAKDMYDDKNSLYEDIVYEGSGDGDLNFKDMYESYEMAINIDSLEFADEEDMKEAEELDADEIYDNMVEEIESERLIHLEEVTGVDSDDFNAVLNKVVLIDDYEDDNDDSILEDDNMDFAAAFRRLYG